MTKLTIEMRRTIRERALKHAFGKRESDLIDARLVIGDAIYDHLVDDATRKALAKVPSDFIHKSTSNYVRIAGHDCQVPFPTPRPVKRGAFLGVIDGSHDLAQDWNSVESDLKAVREERRLATAKIAGVLDSVTTLKRLRDVWPECEPFLHGLERTAPSLPAVPVGDLNKLLGLPVDNQPATEHHAETSLENSV